MSFEQRKALTIINALFGSVLMTSDNIAEYDEKENEILSEALDIFEHAKNKSFVKNDKYIEIKYELNGKEHSFSYNVKKGVMSNVR